MARDDRLTSAGLTTYGTVPDLDAIKLDRSLEWPEEDRQRDPFWALVRDIEHADQAWTTRVPMLQPYYWSPDAITESTGLLRPPRVVLGMEISSRDNLKIVWGPEGPDFDAARLKQRINKEASFGARPDNEIAFLHGVGALRDRALGQRATPSDLALLRYVEAWVPRLVDRLRNTVDVIEWGQLRTRVVTQPDHRHPGFVPDDPDAPCLTIEVATAQEIARGRSEQERAAFLADRDTAEVVQALHDGRGEVTATVQAIARNYRRYVPRAADVAYRMRRIWMEHRDAWCARTLVPFLREDLDPYVSLAEAQAAPQDAAILRLLNDLGDLDPELLLQLWNENGRSAERVWRVLVTDYAFRLSRREIEDLVRRIIELGPGPVAASSGDATPANSDQVRSLTEFRSRREQADVT